MWSCTCRRVVMVGLTISTMQYVLVQSAEFDTSTALYSSEYSTNDGTLGEGAGDKTSQVPQHESTQPNGITNVCNYPEEIKEILQGTSPSYGPGWVSLTWRTSELCTPQNFKGLPLDSVRLEISGGRRKNPASWELSVADNGDWREDNLTLNFTNGSKNCTSDWCWEPCTSYSLKIVPIVKDGQSVMDFGNIFGNLNIRTLIDKVTRDAKVQDLRVVERGSEWLLLRWKVPYCLPDDGKKYTALLYNSPMWKACPEDLNRSVVSINSSGEYYHSYNMTKCNFITFTHCTNYKIRIRGEFGPAKLVGLDTYTHLKSDDLDARTLPHPIANLAFKQMPSASTLKLTWSQVPLCVNYPFSKYRLSVKADSKTISGFSKDINAKCGKGTCEEEVEVLPCTKYEAELTPVYLKYNEHIPPVTASYYTSFPDAGENYNVTTLDFGSHWASIGFGLDPQCLRHVQNLNLLLFHVYSSRPLMSQTVSKETLDRHNQNGRVTFNLTKSKLFPNFHGFQSCNGSYKVQILPKLSSELSQVSNLLPVQTTFELPNINETTIPNAEIREYGVSWLYFIWTPPPCSKESAELFYSLTIYEQANVTNRCSINLSSRTEMTVTSATWCINSPQRMQIKPCTLYSFEVRAILKSQDLNATATRSRSNEIRTLPDTYNSAIRNLETVTVESTSVRLTWQPPPCAHFFVDYGIRVQETYSRKTVFHGAVPHSCLYENNELDWPPLRDCNITAHTGQKVDAFEPCTSYIFTIWPQQRDEKGKALNSVSRHITFTTTFASESYSVTTSSVESEWIFLRITLHPQCLRTVQSFNLTWAEEENPNRKISASVRRGCYSLDSENGTVFMNLSKSSCFPGFDGFESCTGSYKVQSLPELPGIPNPKLGETTFQLQRNNVTSIPKAFIEARGANWILLNWTTPTCTRDLKEDQAYSIKLYKSGNVQTPSFTTIRYTQLNVTSKHGNTTQFQNVSVESCTEYYFEVKALYTVHALNVKTNWTRSNVIRTLPDRTNNYIRDLKILDVEITPVRFTWQLPPCWHFITGYRFVLQEKFTDTKPTTVDVKVPVTCLNKDNELEWPPMPDCGSQIKAVQTIGALEPCTEYMLKVWPLAENESGSTIYVSRNITFTKNPARLGKLDLLKLTGSNETTLTIAWGNITQYPRCLKHYEISATSRVGRKLPLPSVTTGNSYTFTDLEPCTTYQVSVKAIGKANDDFNEEIQEHFTKEPSLGPPQNVKYSLLFPTSLYLMWSAPEKHPQCVKEYRIHISEVETNSTQPVSRNVTTTGTNVHIHDLKPMTNYQFRVSALTNTQSSFNTQAILYITTLPEPEIASPLSITFVIIPVVAGTAIILTLIFCCYFKKCNLRTKNVVNDAVILSTMPPQTKPSPCDRPRKSHYLAAPVEADAAEEIIQSSRNNIPVSQHSMRNLALNRPITVEDFNNIVNELTENTCALLSEQFQDLKLLCNGNLPKTCASKAENKVKNRYVNIIPYDHSRVHLNPVPEDEHGDYINASFVQGFNGTREYIAAQGPKAITVPDFWRMIWEQDISIVVMVTQIEEHGKIKCAQYWPESGQVIGYGNIKVTQVVQVNMGDYVIRDLEVEHGGVTRAVKHMHYLTWPDFGCPQNPESMLSFIEAVRDRISSLSAGGPILVHCSAGIGRTGTFIALDWLTQEARVSSQLDVFNTVSRLRSDRMNMVQTEDQYRFVHTCLSHFLKTSVREQSPIYANAGHSPVYANASHSPIYANASNFPIYSNSSQSPIYARVSQEKKRRKTEETSN